MLIPQLWGSPDKTAEPCKQRHEGLVETDKAEENRLFLMQCDVRADGGAIRCFSTVTDSVVRLCLLLSHRVCTDESLVPSGRAFLYHLSLTLTALCNYGDGMIVVFCTVTVPRSVDFPPVSPGLTPFDPAPDPAHRRGLPPRLPLCPLPWLTSESWSSRV